jgi:cell division protein FtsB
MLTSTEKTGVFVSFFVLLALLCLIIFSNHGVMDYRLLKEKEQTIAGQIRALDQENKTLEKEVRRLKTDLDYLKHLAKHEHDMAEEDELIFKDNTEKKRTSP